MDGSKKVSIEETFFPIIDKNLKICINLKISNKAFQSLDCKCTSIRNEIMFGTQISFLNGSICESARKSLVKFF